MLLRKKLNKIPLTRPYITEEIKNRVSEVLDSGYLTEGIATDLFENAIKSYVGSKYALAVSNCTVGLELALRALGFGPGDEVIIPDYTHPGTASGIAAVGATIVLVDIDPETMLIDYEAVEKAITNRTRAIIPVSLFGNPLDYDRLWSIKEEHGLYLIEDAACSLGSRYKWVSAGNLADISVFSFHPRKLITTGEGGMITTNNSGWAKWMDSYTHFGMGDAQFQIMGTNYKLSNIQATVGLVQMRHISGLLEKRKLLASRYYELLAGVPGISFPKVTPGGIHSWQSFCIFVPNRDQIIEKLREKNIETQIGTYALHLQGAFNRNPNCRITSDMSGSRYAFDHCLTLPLYHDMTDEEQQLVVSELKEAIECCDG
jgi:dTDP-4-amino-4,6-dideoxygalactose transaminase